MLFDAPTQNVFAPLAAWQAEGLKTALAVLINIDGSSPRPRGAAIAVAEDGRHVGIISSGCAEEAIIAEALEVLKDGANRVTRYGKDSPYIDVVLPCGSGLDILFCGSQAGAISQTVTALHGMRKSAFVTPVLSGDISLSVSDASSDNNDDAIEYAPDYHLHVFGAGPQLTGFAALAFHMGYRIFAHSTDEDALEPLRAAGINAQPMTHKTVFNPAGFDAHSAVITLFHDHDLEVPILQAALNSKAHFIGAMGSRKTHAARRALIQGLDTHRPFDDIVGPVGLDIGATDPSEIALSILAQIVERRRAP